MFRYPSITIGSAAGVINSLLLAAEGDSQSVVVSLSTLLGAAVFALVYALRMVLTAHLRELRAINQSVREFSESAKVNQEALLAAIKRPNQDETINRVEKPG